MARTERPRASRPAQRPGRPAQRSGTARQAGRASLASQPRRTRPEASRRHAAAGPLRLGNLEWSVASSPQRVARRKRRRLRPVRRLVFLVVAAGVVCGMIFGGLLLVVPGVGNAPALARALDQAHHVGYPGPAVPPRFSAALVASLDRTFYSEAEPLQVSGTFFGGLIHPSSRTGPTLYQRLAAILYLHGNPGATTGIERSVLGIKLELTYSRAQIMRMYAAVTYFGHGFYGLSSASCGYFARPPARLSWAQAALLAAVAAAPSADDPYAHAARARAAEAAILRQLTSAGVLSRAEASRAAGQALGLLGSAAKRPDSKGAACSRASRH